MWITEGEHWRLDGGKWQASFDAANPAGGLFDLHVDGVKLPATKVLECHNASAGADLDVLVDHYTREDDLVATYLQSPARVNRKQIYLRPAGFLYPEPLTGVELVFSMQTQRLDADPQLVIRSEFSCAAVHALLSNQSPKWESLSLTEEAIDLPSTIYGGAIAAQISGTDITFAQIMDPADYSGGRLVQQAENSDRFAISQPVFCSSLEKGVIRRGRATALWVRGNDALEVVARFHQWYRTSPPQLTT